MNTTTISFETYRSTRIRETLIAVTDNELWLSANATNGGATDSIVVRWGHGNHQNSVDVLKSAMNIEIGDVICMDVERSTDGSLFGFVVGKVS